MLHRGPPPGVASSPGGGSRGSRGNRDNRDNRGSRGSFVNNDGVIPRPTIQFDDDDDDESIMLDLPSLLNVSPVRLDKFSSRDKLHENRIDTPIDSRPQSPYKLDMIDEYNFSVHDSSVGSVGKTRTDSSSMILLPELDSTAAKIEVTMPHNTFGSQSQVQTQFLVKKSSSASMVMDDLQERYKYQPPTSMELRDIDADLISLSDSVQSSLRDGISTESKLTVDKSVKGLRSIQIHSVGDRESTIMSAYGRTFSLTNSPSNYDIEQDELSLPSAGCDNDTNNTNVNNIHQMKYGKTINQRGAQGGFDSRREREMANPTYFPYASGANDTSQYFEERAVSLRTIEEESPSMILVNNYNMNKTQYSDSNKSVDLSRSLKSFSQSRVSDTPEITDADSRTSDPIIMPHGNFGRKNHRNIWENKKIMLQSCNTPTNYVGSDHIHQTNKQKKTKNALIDFADTTTKWYTPITQRPIVLESKQKSLIETFPAWRGKAHDRKRFEDAKKFNIMNVHEQNKLRAEELLALKQKEHADNVILMREKRLNIPIGNKVGNRGRVESVDTTGSGVLSIGDSEVDGETAIALSLSSQSQQ